MNNIKSKVKGPKQPPSYLPWLFVCSLTFIIVMILISQWLIKEELVIEPEPDQQQVELDLPSAEFENSASTKETPSQETESEEIKEKWHTITIQKKDTLEKIFQNLNVDIPLNKILNLNKDTRQLKSLKTGKEIQILLQDNTQFKQLVFPLTPRKVLHITLDGKAYQSKIVEKPVEKKIRHTQSTIKHSLYVDAKRADIHPKLIRQLTKIFSAEIDFAKDLRPGDKYAILYEEQYVDGEKISTDEILAATFINQGDSYTAIRYTDTRGHTDYYSPSGTSLRKALLRFPVKFSHISSPFSERRLHPVIRVIRPHRGVDFAARLGAPVSASGEGKIVQIGENATYGKFIKIQHNKTYHTLYAHMLRFNKGMYSGIWVKQGQVIGFIGQSGLATGAHLHYELHKNNKPVNPMTTHLPFTRPLDKANLNKFRAHSNALLAQMKLREVSQLASKNK